VRSDGDTTIHDRFDVGFRGARRYFPVAYAIRRPPDVPPVPNAILINDITQFGRDHSANMFLFKSPKLLPYEDSEPANQHSPVLVYEDNKVLGPPHSIHHDIETIGMGRYSHWTGFGLMFSSSDNTDPRYNGRTYWAVIP